MEVVSINNAIVSREQELLLLREQVASLSQENAQLKAFFLDALPADDVLAGAKGKLHNVVVVGKTNDDGSLYVACSSSHIAQNYAMISKARLVFERVLLGGQEVADDDEDEEEDQ